jgi:hypothetical protein
MIVRQGFLAAIGRKHRADEKSVPVAPAPKAPLRGKVAQGMTTSQSDL